MISDDEEKRIISKKFNDFKYSTALHEIENNYALSVCYRQSFIHKPITLELGEFNWSEKGWYKIVEPDPWQERIVSNYQELNGRFQYKNDYVSDYIYVESSCSETESESE